MADESFDSFLDSAIKEGLDKEQMAGLQEKYMPAPPPAEPSPVETKPAPVEAAPKIEPKVEPDWKSALEFSKDLDTAPTDPKPAPEKYQEKPPGTVTPKAENAWATLRQRATQADAAEEKLKAAEARVLEIEAKIKDLDGKEIVSKEIWAKTLKDQEELTATLKITNLEATPEFKSVISAPMQQVRDQAKILSERYNVSLRDIINALEEPDENKQADMLSDIAETGQFKDKSKLDLFRYGDQMRDLNAKKNKLTENVARTLEVIEHQRKLTADTQQKAFEANWGTALDKAWKNLEKNIWMFQKSDTDTEWNKSLDDLKGMVQGVKFYEKPLETQAQILYQAAMVPRVLKALVEARDRILSQDAALAKYRGITPGAGSGGGSGGSNAAPVKQDDGMGFVDAMLR